MRIIALSQAMKLSSGTPQYLLTSSDCEPFKSLLSTGCFKVIKSEQESLEDCLLGNIKKPDSLYVFDNYDVTHEKMSMYRETGCTLAAIDDLGDREFDVDVLINHNFGAEELYLTKSEKTTYLLGPKYCLLRECFARKRSKPVLMTLGGGNVRARLQKLQSGFHLLDQHLQESVTIQLVLPNQDLVQGLEFNYQQIVFEFVKGSFDISDLIHKSSFVISACGSTIYEIATIGRKVLGIIIADNQQYIGQNIEKNNLGVFLGDINNLDDNAFVNGFMALHKKQQEELFDGKGAARVAEQLEEMVCKNKRNKHLYFLVKESSEKFSNQVFIRSNADDFPNVSFTELHCFVEGFHYYCISQGIKSGCRLAVVIPNTNLSALIMIAVMASGRTLVPINPKMGIQEILYIMDDSNPDAVINLTSRDIDTFQLNKPIFRIENEEKFYHAIISGETSPITLIDKHDGAEIVYTSGSTGNPKGVLINHENLMSNTLGIYERLQPESNDRFLTITPLFHNSGQFLSTFVPLLAGASCVVIRPEIGLSHFWFLINRYKINWTLGMPTHINYLLRNEQGATENTLKGILVGGARLEDDNHAEFQKRFSVPILKTYGLTETCSFATCDYINPGMRVIGSSGRALLTNEIEIFDEENNVLDSNCEGEIRIKGENIFQEYVNRSELTQSKFHKNWFCTGDLGYKDDSGNIYIKDRMDNMIIVSGENVYPAEVENHIPSLIGIKLGVLSSVPDKLSGQKLVLVYEALDDSPKNESSWIQSLQEKVVFYKVPREFIRVEKLGINCLPKASNGKILRKKVKDALLKVYEVV